MNKPQAAIVATTLLAIAGWVAYTFLWGYLENLDWWAPIAGTVVPLALVGAAAFIVAGAFSFKLGSRLTVAEEDDNEEQVEQEPIRPYIGQFRRDEPQGRASNSDS